MEEKFIDITSDILKNKKFQMLKLESHHGDNRYNHSLRVALETYNYTKNHSMDYKRATRAALLHDFFLRKELENPYGKGELIEHPKVACQNAKKFFNIDEETEEMMIDHMWPITHTKPKTNEGIVISLTDKKVSIKETLKYRMRKKGKVR